MKTLILTVEELTAFGVSKQAVYKAKQNRRISLKNGRLDALKALGRLKKNRDPTKPDALIKALELAVAERGATPAEPEAESAPNPSEGESYFSARERRERAEADIKELEAGKMRGDLLPTADVQAAWSEMVISARAILLALPARLAQKLSMESDPINCEQAMREVIDQALGQLSRHELGDAS